ncbi:MAG: heme-binding protein [Gemmatimonadaceae bacterium]
MRSLACTRHTMLLGAIIIAAAAKPTAAQQVATKQTLTLDGARRVIGAAQAEARKSHAAGVVAVVDDGGNLIAVERLDGTFAAGANISIGKARTAVLFKKPTKFFEDVIRNGRTAMVTVEGFTPLQGGIPILVDGQVVGGVGVSGAASAQQDEELAIAGAAAIALANVASTGSGAGVVQAAMSSGPAPTAYWNARDVAASFAKGAVLLDGAGNRNYMVHTSRRGKPGMAEVHTLDTDIIYVLHGSATLVTGGTVVGGHATEADELRGASIEQGTSRELAPGDVIVIPSGTPHWFQRVSAPIDYFTVKVR